MDDTKLIEEDRIKLEILVKEDFNPWAVSDASVFLRYCCPECEFQSKGLITFGEHAITNHHRSSVLFKPEETELKYEIQDDINLDNSDDENYDPLLVEPKEKINLTKTISEESVVEPESYDNLVISSVQFDSDDEISGVTNINSVIGVKSTKKSRKQALNIRHEESDTAVLGENCDVSNIDPVMIKIPKVEETSINQQEKSCKKNVKRMHNGDAICEHCGKSFTNREGLSKHIKNIHNTDVMYVCESCGFSTNSKIKLSIHNRNTHLTDKMKTCQHCGKQFPQITKLEVHIDRVHSDSGPKNYACDKCEKTFIYERSLKEHKYSCSNQEWVHEQRRRQSMGLTKKVTFHKPRAKPATDRKRMEPTKCDYCDVVFERRAQICRHYEEFHSGKPILLENIELFKCDQCDAVYTQGQALNAHAIKAHGKRTAHKKFCEHCNLEYANVHNCPKESENGSAQPVEEKSQECPHCNKILKGKKSIYLHLRRFHSELKLECHMCDKKFATDSFLKMHIKGAHSPAFCDICGNKSSSENELKRHKVLVHKILKGAWLCQSCPKSVFFSQKSYDLHLKKKH